MEKVKEVKYAISNRKEGITILVHSDKIDKFLHDYKDAMLKGTPFKIEGMTIQPGNFTLAEVPFTTSRHKEIARFFRRKIEENGTIDECASVKFEAQVYSYLGNTMPAAIALYQSAEPTDAIRIDLTCIELE
jgi:hypothetical protein